MPRRSDRPAPVEKLREVAKRRAQRRDGRYDIPINGTPSTAPEPAKPAAIRPTPQAAVPSPSKDVYQPAPDPLASLSPNELARRYNQLVAQETRIQAAAAGIPLGQFQQLSYEEQVALSGGAGLSPQDAKLLDQLEQRLTILPASRPDTPNRTAQAEPVAEAKFAARPAPQAPVPSPAWPPGAAEPELTDEEKIYLQKQGRIRIAQDGSYVWVSSPNRGR